MMDTKTRTFNVRGVPDHWVDDGPWTVLMQPVPWTFVQGDQDDAFTWLYNDGDFGGRHEDVQWETFPSLAEATNGARRLYPGCVGGETIIAKNGQEYQLLDMERFMVYCGMRLVWTQKIDYEKEIEEELQEWPKRHRRKIMNGP